MIPAAPKACTYLTKGPFAFNFWIVEMLLGMIVPMITAAVQTDPHKSLLAHDCSVPGCRRRGRLPLGHEHHGTTGAHALCPGPAITYTSYRPSLIEILTGAAIIAYGLTAFSLGVKYLRVVDHTLVEAEHEKVHVKSSEPVRI